MDDARRRQHLTPEQLEFCIGMLEGGPPRLKLRMPSACLKVPSAGHGRGTRHLELQPGDTVEADNAPQSRGRTGIRSSRHAVIGSGQQLSCLLTSCRPLEPSFSLRRYADGFTKQGSKPGDFSQACISTTASDRDEWRGPKTT